MCCSVWQDITVTSLINPPNYLAVLLCLNITWRCYPVSWKQCILRKFYSQLSFVFQCVVKWPSPFLESHSPEWRPTVEAWCLDAESAPVWAGTALLVPEGTGGSGLWLPWLNKAPLPSEQVLEDAVLDGNVVTWTHQDYWHGTLFYCICARICSMQIL